MLIPESVRRGGATLCLRWVTPAGTSRLGAASGALDRRCLRRDAGRLPPLALEDAEGSRRGPACFLSCLFQTHGRPVLACGGLPASMRARGLPRGAQQAEAWQAWVGDAAPGRGAGPLLSRRGLWPVHRSRLCRLVFLELGSRLWQDGSLPAAPE